MHKTPKQTIRVYPNPSGAKHYSPGRTLEAGLETRMNSAKQAVYKVPIRTVVFVHGPRKMTVRAVAH